MSRLRRLLIAGGAVLAFAGYCQARTVFNPFTGRPDYIGSTSGSSNVRISTGGITPQTGGYFVQSSTIEANQDEMLRLIRFGAAGPFKNALIMTYGENSGTFFLTSQFGYLNTSGAGWGIRDGSAIDQLRVVKDNSGVIGVGNEIRKYDTSGTKYVADASSGTIPTSYAIVQPSVVGSVGQVPTIASIVGTAVYESFSTPAGAGAITSTLATGTGTASNFTTNTTSPTLAISLLGSQFKSATNGTTNFYSLNQDSVTVQGLFVAGSNITLTPSGTQTTIAATSSGGGGYSLEPATVPVRVSTLTINVQTGSGIADYFSSTQTQLVAISTGIEKQPWEIGFASVCVGPETQFSAATTYQDFCSFQLGAGLWGVTVLYFAENGGGTNPQFDGAFSTLAGNDCSDCTSGYNLVEGPGPVLGAHQETLVLPDFVVRISTPTRYYLKGYMNYTGVAPYLRSSMTAIRR